MNSRSKLRMSVGLFYPIAIFSCYILAILEWYLRTEMIKNGADIAKFPFLTYFICGAFFFVMGIFQWFKYRLWVYPVLGLLVGFLCVQWPGIVVHSYYFSKGSYMITFFATGLFILLNWPTLYSQERFEINSRRLFRLAAELIRDTSGGFTERPYSAGKLIFNRDEFLGFSRYLNGKYVAKTIHFEDRIYFAFSMNQSLVKTDDPKEVSHVVIDFDGNISVSIAEKDYRDYLNQFSFDQICSSMAAVFERFLGYYRQGLEARIITELKTAR